MEFEIDFRNLPFTETSKTGSHWNRLNWRCEILLTRNKGLIQGKRVLDLASHDGRFSYACLKLGASHVVGIEGRDYLVDFAKENIKKLGFKSHDFDFINDDIFKYLRTVQKHQFDIVLCFGFFYHTIRQIELLKEMIRIAPHCFMLDTSLAGVIYPAEGFKLTHKYYYDVRVKYYKEKLLNKFKLPSLVFDVEDHELESSTIDTCGLVARPTESFLQLFFGQLNWKFKKLQWCKVHIRDWTWLNDYKAGKRVSYLCFLPRA